MTQVKSATHSPTLEAIQRSKEVTASLPSSTSKDVILQNLQLALIQNEARRSVQIAKPETKSSATLLIDIANATEALQAELIRSSIDYQKDLSKENAEQQQEMNRLLAERRKNAITLQEIDYAAKIASAVLSVFSIGVGATLAATGTPTGLIPGSMMIASGVSSLASLALEALGYDNSVTKPLAVSGFVVGTLATVVGGYMNPALMQDKTFRLLMSAKAIVQGFSMIAEAQQSKTSMNTEAELTLERKNQELLRLKMSAMLQDLKETVNLLSNSKQISAMLNQQQQLLYQYLNLNPLQG